jgi:MoaA/NifB/PqqE/SkfB family radical SAM enzyme
MGSNHIRSRPKLQHLFITAALLLTEELAVLLSRRLYQLTFSLNAASPQTYQRDMGGTRWNDVLDNIRAARRHIPREKSRSRASCTATTWRSWRI